MPVRKTILATNEVYHILNCSPHQIPIFKKERDYQIFLETIKYYLQKDPPTRFSFYRREKEKYLHQQNKDKVVSIIGFCIMPNHFHFILRQELDNGIKQFIQKLSNSFAHYFNKKYKTHGSVFEANFKAKHLETDEQLWHLSRYIHLNPVTAYLVENPKDYPYSSYLTYLGKERNEIVDPSLVMQNFTPETYEKFVLNQKEYQRKLSQIKHLLLESI